MDGIRDEWLWRSLSDAMAGASLRLRRQPPDRGRMSFGHVVANLARDWATSLRLAQGLATLATPWWRRLPEKSAHLTEFHVE